MDRNLFNIRTVETEAKSILGRTRIQTSFIVEYKGVEILKTISREVAENCVEEAVSIRDDAQWAFENALRSVTKHD